MKIKILLLFIFSIITAINAQNFDNDNFINKITNTNIGENAFFRIYKRNNGTFGYYVGTKIALDLSGDAIIDVKNKTVTFFNYFYELDKGNGYTLAYKESDKHLLYNEFLGDYPLLSSRIKSGDVRYFNNIKVITMEDTNIRTDYKIYIRENPSIDSDYYELYFLFNKLLITFLSQEDFNNKIVTVIGRTDKQYKINDKNDYWYLIKFNPYNYYSYDSVNIISHKSQKIIDKYIFAWIYGGYIELIKNNNNTLK
jgi:hypothetical protein